MPVNLKITREYKLVKILYNFLEYRKVQEVHGFEKRTTGKGTCFKCETPLNPKKFVHLGFLEHHENILLCTACADGFVKKNQVEVIHSLPRKV